jgi:probable rRNA maturation factor
MIEINNKTRSKINLSLIRQVAVKFLDYYKINKDVSVALVGDKTMKRLNKQSRGIDRVTDVLAFVDDDPEFLGEIIINYAQIKRQAPRFDNSVRAELTFVLVHGLLHLLGYEDETREGKQEMERLGKKFVNRLQIHK